MVAASRCWGGVALAATLGCAEPAVPVLQPRDVCGEPGPVQILALSDNERVVRVFRVSDADPRLIHWVSTLDGPTPYESENIVYRTMITGPCGEDPKTLAVNARPLLVVGDQELVCGPDGALILTSLDGDEPPTTLFSGSSCFVWQTDEGLITIGLDGDSAWGPMVLLTKPSYETVTLVEAVPLPYYTELPWVGRQEVVTATLDSRVVQADLRDQSTTVLASPAARMIASNDGRWILWQEGEASPDVTAHTVGPIHLRDRQSGRDVVLVDGDLKLAPAAFRDDFVVLPEEPWSDRERVWILPDAREVALPPEARARGRVPDGRLWYGIDPQETRREEHLLDMNTGEDTVVFEGNGFVREIDDTMYVFEAAANGSIQHGTLRTLDLRNDASETVARGIHAHWRETPDRQQFITVQERVDDRIGTLRLFGPEHVEGVVLDEGVTVESTVLWHRAPVGRDLLYNVIDPPERAGLWRLSPP